VEAVLEIMINGISFTLDIRGRLIEGYQLLSIFEREKLSKTFLKNSLCEAFLRLILSSSSSLLCVVSPLL